jgi:hypothetical protein
MINETNQGLGTPTPRPRSGSPPESRTAVGGFLFASENAQTGKIMLFPARTVRHRQREHHANASASPTRTRAPRRPEDATQHQRGAKPKTPPPTPRQRHAADAKQPAPRSQDPLAAPRD